MMNFLLGTLAGGLIACVATITALRQPEIQSRLGLFPVSSAMMTPAAQSQSRTDPACPPAKASGADASVGQPEMLFSKRRFWFVAP